MAEKYGGRPLQSCRYCGKQVDNANCVEVAVYADGRPSWFPFCDIYCMIRKALSAVMGTISKGATIRW